MLVRALGWRAPGEAFEAHPSRVGGGFSGCPSRAQPLDSGHYPGWLDAGLGEPLEATGGSAHSGGG